MAGGIEVTKTGDDYFTLQQILNNNYCSSPRIPDCSVRSALTLAQFAGSGVDIPAGTYVLGNGSLYIDRPSQGTHVAMTGDGMDQTILIGASDRLLTINTRADLSEITLTGITFKGGFTQGVGGGI